MTKSELRALAASAAASHAVTKVAEGVGANLSAREWRDAVRSPVKVAAGATNADYSIPVYFVVDHLGVEHARNCVGEWLY